MKTMKDVIAKLAYTRKVEAEYKAEIAQADAAIKETSEWKYLEQRREYLKTVQADVADAEIKVRKEALDIFAETGNNIPHPAVKIKRYTVLDYKEADAIEYAREHLPEALKLVRGVFKNAAKVVKMDFVAIRQEPRATIARNLSEYLPK